MALYRLENDICDYKKKGIPNYLCQTLLSEIEQNVYLPTKCCYNQSKSRDNEKSDQNSQMLTQSDSMTHMEIDENSYQSPLKRTDTSKFSFSNQNQSSNLAMSEILQQSSGRKKLDFEADLS